VNHNRNPQRVLVVGAGVFGVSAARALKARGHAVSILDLGPLPRVEAASTDISKIVRMDYGADDFYMDLMERALGVWRTWNEHWGYPLYHEDGFLLLSCEAFASGGFEQESLQRLRKRGHAAERWQPSTLAARWPAWNAARYRDGYFNPAAGWVESGRVMERLLAAAAAEGVDVMPGAAFDQLAESGSRIIGAITKDGRTIAADTVLVAAGAWTPVLLPWLEPVLWTVAQPVFHLKPADPGSWCPPAFTVWAADIARTGWYGFPATASGIVKIANHGPGRRVHPDAPRTTRPEDELALRSFLRESLPALYEAPLAASKTCLYCDSFDGDFWIGRDPERPGLAVAAGDSGHGFKFAPVLGAVIADAVEAIDTPATRRFAWRAPGTRRTEDARFGMS
jgi:glycine/D-amino acid oxidase-like deaminating enzyme